MFPGSQRSKPCARRSTPLPTLPLRVMVLTKPVVNPPNDNGIAVVLPAGWYATISAVRLLGTLALLPDTFST